MASIFRPAKIAVRIRSTSSSERGRDIAVASAYRIHQTNSQRQEIKHMPLIASTAASGLDGSDVDLFHRHHRLEHALGDGGVGIGDPFGQSHRCNLPTDAPLVLAPAARVLLTAVADDSVPV